MFRLVRLSAAAILSVVAVVGCSAATELASAQGDIAIGADEGAKVTVVEYASVTCGACAAWQAQVYEPFKAKYIDSNQIRFVFREYPTPPEDVAAAGFLMARCAGEDKYIDIVHEIMASQPELFGGTPPRNVLLRIANGAGLSEEEFTQCVTDADNIAALEDRVRQAVQAGVNGTPTFIVNGQRLPGIPSLEDLSVAIDSELAK